jgi:hypothetical protein
MVFECALSYLEIIYRFIGNISLYRYVIVFIILENLPQIPCSECNVAREYLFRSSGLPYRSGYRYSISQV